MSVHPKSGPLEEGRLLGGSPKVEAGSRGRRREWDRAGWAIGVSRPPNQRGVREQASSLCLHPGCDSPISDSPISGSPISGSRPAGPSAGLQALGRIRAKGSAMRAAAGPLDRSPRPRRAPRGPERSNPRGPGPAAPRRPAPPAPPYLRSPGPPFYFLEPSHKAPRGPRAPAGGRQLPRLRTRPADAEPGGRAGGRPRSRLRATPPPLAALATGSRVLRGWAGLPARACALRTF